VFLFQYELNVLFMLAVNIVRPSLIAIIATIYNWNIVESGVKQRPPIWLSCCSNNVFEYRVNFQYNLEPSWSRWSNDHIKYFNIFLKYVDNLYYEDVIALYILTHRLQIWANRSIDTCIQKMRSSEVLFCVYVSTTEFKLWCLFISSGKCCTFWIKFVRQFYGLHQDLVKHYGISVYQMTWLTITEYLCIK
jgi:hypothetical protein